MADTSPASHTARRAGLVFILITLWIDVLSWSVTIPVFPKLIIEFMNNDIAEASAISGVLMTLYAAIQLFAAPVLGGLSDHYGRRPVILLACAGLAIDLAIMAVAPNIWWLVLTRVIHAVTAAINSAAGAYIADVTAPPERARAFGYMGAAFSFGFILGPGIGGLLGEIDIRAPFYAGAILAFLNVLYGYFVLPESLAPDNRSKFEWRQANPFGAIKFLGSDAKLLALASVNFLTQLSFQIYPALWVLYTSYRYQWDAMMVGITLAASGIASMLVQSFLVGPVVKRVGERGAMLIAFCFSAAGLAIEGWAPTTLFFLLGIPIGALGNLAGPALSSLISQRVAPDQQGRLQGANSALISIGGLFGPLMFTGVFAFAIADASTLHVPGAPFYIAAALVIAAALMAAQATRPVTTR